MSGPLHGKKIIITREEKGANVFSHKVLQYGAIPIVVPLLKISCKDHADNLHILANLSNYEWLIFTSANGVDCFFELITRQQVELNELKKLKIAVVGHKTEENLESYGFVADFIPSTYNAETLSREFLVKVKNPGRILLVRGNLSRDTLPIEFTKAGLAFETVEVYDTTYNLENKIHLNQALKSDYDFITFTSPSSVDAFYDMANMNTTKPIVSIGTTTQEHAIEMGLGPILVPNREYTIDGMIQCMIDYINKGEL